MVIMMTAFVVAVAWCVTTLVRHGSPSGRSSSTTVAPVKSSAQSVLDERYARSEIDEAEYRRRQAVLSDGPTLM